MMAAPCNFRGGDKKMAKRNRRIVREHRMKRHEDSGFTEGNSKYARKRRLQLKGIYSPNSPFRAA